MNLLLVNGMPSPISGACLAPHHQNALQATSDHSRASLGLPRPCASPTIPLEQFYTTHTGDTMTLPFSWDLETQAIRHMRS